MATYRFEAKIVGRSQGRSATASAAYRAGERLEDERTGTVFDYTRKRGVLYAEIMAPAGTPDWMKDRAQLWNAVEKAEKRKDSQLARDLLVSLPHELTHEQRRQLTRDFVGREFVAKGMIADVAIHAPDRRGDPRNHHAHVLLTMRELTGGGFGHKVRTWNDNAQLDQWREHWAETINHHLERHGHSARVDHRSLTDQGVDREPEPKQGPRATELEREGRPSHAGDDRRAVQARNEERATVEASLSTIAAEIVDIEQERAKRGWRNSDAGSPLVATPDGGMVAQQREANKLLARHRAAQGHQIREPATDSTARAIARADELERRQTLGRKTRSEAEQSNESEEQGTEEQETGKGP